jgi:hypothetical protein
MAKIAASRARSDHRYSTTILWISLLTALLLIPVLLETVSLGVLYANDFLKGKDTSKFAKRHLLTRLFASTSPGPVAGKKFVSDLRFDVLQRTKWAIPDDLLGWRLATNSSVVYDLNPSGQYLYTTDDHGFISDVDDSPITLQKSAEIYRIIILGGSTVMGEGAPRPSQNIVGMLRKGVQARRLTGPDGKRVEFINAGVDGYNSAQEYLYLMSDLLRFKPDLVIVYDGWNDSIYDFNNNVSPFRTRYHVDNEGRIIKSYSLIGSIRLVAWNFKTLLTASSFRLGAVELPWLMLGKFWSKGDTDHASLADFDPRNLEAYDKNHRAFLALADDRLSVALFLQPVVGVDDRTLSAEEKAAWWNSRIDQALPNRVPFYEGARHILADFKVGAKGNSHSCIADLTHSLRDVSETVYADTGHLLPKGNEVLASHMLDELVSCGLLR